MAWQLSLLITIALIILGFVFKKSNAIWFLQIIWIWILLSCNAGGSDWNVHNHFFLTSDSGISIFSSAWLYQLICLPFLKLGYEFFNMNLVVSTIALLFYFKIIKENSTKKCFVTSLFIIFPLADAIIQKRNFLACIIFLYGLLKFLKSEKKAISKYIIFTLIAAQIHSAFYIYLIFVPFLKMDLVKLKKTIPILIVISFMMIPFIPKIAQLLLGSTSLAFKVTYYFESFKIPLYQSCCWWALQIIFTWIFLSASKNNQIELTEKEDTIRKNLDKLNILLLLFLPLYYYEATFFRLYRNILLVNYIFSTNLLFKAKKWTKNSFYNIIILVFIVFLVFLTQFVLFGLGFDFLVKPLFEKNSILGG